MVMLSVVFLVDDALPGEGPLVARVAGDFFALPRLFLPGDYDREADDALMTFCTNLPTFEGVSVAIYFLPFSFLEMTLGGASAT